MISKIIISHKSLHPLKQVKMNNKSIEFKKFILVACLMLAISSITQAQQYFQQQQVSTTNSNNLFAPTIIPFSFNQNVQENQRAIVMCTTSSGEIPVNFTWSKDGQLLTQTISQLKRIQIKHDQDSSTLKISSVRLDHAGNYSCLARNKHGSQFYQAQLIVHGEPRWLREPPHEPLVTTRGQTVIIDCQTTGWPKPQQSWQIKAHTQGEFELVNFGGRISLAPNGSLIIRQADKTDEANYLCKSFNGIGRGLSWSTSLKVTVPAHFDSANRQQTSIVRKQNQVQLRCDAYGDQPITIEWYKNKQLLPVHDLQEPRYSIHSNNNPLKNGLISQLSIKQAQRNDNALFECVTRNAYGRDRLPIELIVQEEPEHIQELQLTEVKSRSVTLAWTEPYDGRSAITNYMFQYKRVQSNLPMEAYQSAANVASSISMLDSYDYLDSMSALSSNHQDHQTTSTSIKSSSSASDTDWQHANRLMLPVNSGANFDQQQQTNVSLANVVRSLTIEKLEPSSKYILRALAINSIGQSKFSQPMEFATDEEAPEVGPVNIRASAINSTSIQVTWDEIPKSKHLGRIHGYYIGYRVASNNSAAANFIYKPYIIKDLIPTTAEASDSATQPANRLETVLNELRRDTLYEITVVAFNSRGSGPSSDFVLCKTVEMEAPKHVKLEIRRELNDSIVIEWQRDPSDQNPVDDYALYQEKNSASKEWLQVRLPGNQTQYRASGLKCGTRYQFYIIAHNKVGKSQPSEVVSAATSGSLPIIPSKSSLITKLNSTCLLINLNSFQDNSCRIKSFTVRYRVEKSASAAGASISSDNLVTVAASNSAGNQQQAASTSGALIGSNGLAATHSALTSSSAQSIQASKNAAQQVGSGAQLLGAVTAAAVVGGSGQSAGNEALSNGGQTTSEWISVRPRGGRYLFGNRHNHHHGHWLGLNSDEDRMEYLCDLNPMGEYTIHVAASNDVGRSEIEYTVLMSSDELKHSLFRDLLEFFNGLPNVFAYIPSIIVFLLAGLLLSLVSLILYTTAIKYYQKFIIMQNQMRATRRAKADEKRRRKLANGRGSGSGSSPSSRNSAKLELWADEYEEELGEEDDLEADREDDERQQHQMIEADHPIIMSTVNSINDDCASDELNSSSTASTLGACSSSSSSLAARRAMFHQHQHYHQHSASHLSAGQQQKLQRQRQEAHSKRRRQRHSVHRAHPATNGLGGGQSAAGHYYLSNIANSAFDTSSIDTASGRCAPTGKYAGSTCMSTASADSIHGRFQCLNSKQCVKMNEYTMLPSISATLGPAAANSIYGTSHGAINHGALRAVATTNTTTTTNSSGTGSPSSQQAVASTGAGLYYSTLRRTNMQTYLPQQQVRQAPNQQNNDIYGYYMTPAQQSISMSAAAQQASVANEAAHSIFVPPHHQQQQQQAQQQPQIVYSAPNIRRQIQQQQTSPQVFL